MRLMLRALLAPFASICHRDIATSVWIFNNLLQRGGRFT